MISKHILKIIFLNKAELVFFCTELNSFQRGPGSDREEGVLRIPQSSSITDASLSVV